MNSTLTLMEEQQGTSSTELSRVPKYKIPRTPLAYFRDVATSAIVFTTEPGPYFMYSITAPRIDLTFAPKRAIKHPSIAMPVVSPLEFEFNPIIRVYPATGKRYPMRVVKHSVALFSPTFSRTVGEET